jgi:glycosyltransferase involved in cell wall biosynthesis
MPYGVVAIGRNEGERLRQCLVSVAAASAPLVYVDSGSTDGSVELATSLGAEVVRLDRSVPFTAARARNQGFARLLEAAPGLEYVQFVDGDCEVAAGWLDFARSFLDTHPEVVAVSGRRRERHPERTIYNTLCDLDWQWTPGESTAFGGDVMLRSAALRAVGGYDPTLIAGEEPELGIRLRRAGWKIWQDPHPMTWHDADLKRFGQWWRRTLRTGFAYAQGAAMYGAAPERHWVRERDRALLWGCAWPVLTMLAAAVSPWLGAACLAAYPAQVVRLAIKSKLPPRLAAVTAFFRVLGKFAEAAGVLRFYGTRRRRAGARLIEYK